MKATVILDNLKNGISFAHHGVSGKAQLPILLNFLLQAKDGNLYVSSTDLEIGIIAKIPAKIEEDGETTVPAKTFSELISILPIGKITLETKENGLELTGDKIKTVFQTTKAEEFPKLYESKGEEIMVMDKHLMGKGLAKVVFAASQDQTRPALSVILIKEVEE